jgi:membrane associated rhomboid family serine protease
MAAGGLLAGILLMGLLRDLGYSPARALIFLWSPLLVFETAHAAHVDGLVLPFLVGAPLSRELFI